MEDESGSSEAAERRGRRGPDFSVQRRKEDGPESSDDEEDAPDEKPSDERPPKVSKTEKGILKPPEPEDFKQRCVVAGCGR